jgi:hypothetical protein
MTSSVENTHSYRQYLEPQLVLPPVQQRKRMTEDQALCWILLMFFIVTPLLIMLLHEPPRAACDNDLVFCEDVYGGDGPQP